jgi:hypothetical protein
MRLIERAADRFPHIGRVIVRRNDDGDRRSHGAMAVLIRVGPDSTFAPRRFNGRFRLDFGVSRAA